MMPWLRSAERSASNPLRFFAATALLLMLLVVTSCNGGRERKDELAMTPPTTTGRSKVERQPALDQDLPTMFQTATFGLG